MRVVVGYDGSGRSEVAAALVAAVAWPAGSEFHFVHAIATRAASPPPDVLSSAAGRVPRETALQDAEVALDHAEKWLDAIEGAHLSVGYGRAANVLSDEAGRIGADLVIVGSGGRGPYASLLLGSVSADVVDSAPCPVLVARRPTLERVVLATDGSETSELAAKLVAEWPMFEAGRIKVVSVGDALHGFGALRRADDSSVTVATARDRARKRKADHEAIEFDHVTVATATARRLRRAGRHARATIRLGDPSEQILEVIKSSHADVIVMGTRGHVGFARAILGSAAREVLLATEASVLVVR